MVVNNINENIEMGEKKNKEKKSTLRKRHRH